jgi:hypothetical protein
MAVLALQKNVRRIVRIIDGEHDDRSGMMDHIPPYLDSPGLDHMIGRDPEDWSAIHGA